MSHVCFKEAMMFCGVPLVWAALPSMVGLCAAQRPSLTNEHSCVRMFSVG